MNISKGRFYEFHKHRVVSPPGAPVFEASGMEIGPEIGREVALSRVRAGKDVYTPERADAHSLAAQVRPDRPTDELPHSPPQPTRSKREDVYFRHFHPGGEHPTASSGGPGHVFYGQRGERFEARPDKAGSE
jgi:hypothetical protein